MAFARSIFTLEKLDILEGREGGEKDVWPRGREENDARCEFERK